MLGQVEKTRFSVICEICVTSASFKSNRRPRYHGVKEKTWKQASHS